jgi:3-isopropylmalate/(R)-2-methylmalate dehydratase small subunit
METLLKGKVIWKFGDNFNADLIVGSKYIEERDPEILGKVCLSAFDPDFSKKVTPGDIMIAGKNFGYGHPHYQGIMSLKKVGISVFIAESFYPIWYRIAIFYAFPVIICPGITKKAEVKHDLEVNIINGQIKNLSTGELLVGEGIPPALLEIVQADGLVSHLKGKTK